MRIALHRTGLLTSACLLSLAAGAHADTIELPPSKDNTLYEDPAGALSNGSGEHFFVGESSAGRRRRGLIAFDVAGSIPAGSTIESVTLTLFMSHTISGGQVIEIFPMLADWGEGASDAADAEGDGAPAADNDATWLHNFFDDSLWTEPGGDFRIIASQTLQVNAVGPHTWGSSPAMVDDVQRWLDDPQSNFGWMILGNEGAPGTAKRFDTRENTIAGQRPVLRIEFTPPDDATPLPPTDDDPSSSDDDADDSASDPDDDMTPPADDDDGNGTSTTPDLPNFPVGSGCGTGAVVGAVGAWLYLASMVRRERRSFRK